MTKKTVEVVQSVAHREMLEKYPAHEFDDRITLGEYVAGEHQRLSEFYTAWLTFGVFLKEDDKLASQSAWDDRFMHTVG